VYVAELERDAPAGDAGAGDASSTQEETKLRFHVLDPQKQLAVVWLMFALIRSRHVIARDSRWLL